MIGVIFYGEDSTDSIIWDVALWTENMRYLGVDWYIIIDDTVNSQLKQWEDSHIESHVVNNMDDAIKLQKQIHPNAKRLWFVKDGKKSINTFKRPEDVVLIFGEDTGNPVKPLEGDETVSIPAKGNLWAFSAMSIAMNRLVKWQ